MAVVSDVNYLLFEELPLEEVPITSKQHNDILNIQKTIFKMIARRENYHIILDKLCKMAESLLSNAVASIMIKDSKTGLLNVLSAPSLSKEGVKALNGLRPSRSTGSCGNAIYNNKPHFVKDTFHDERWSDIRQVAYDFNVCACWSMPVRDKNGTAVGTFALSSFEYRNPSYYHKIILETISEIISIILENKTVDQKINNMSNFDILTGIQNKHSLDETLSDGENDFSLIQMDLNNISYINSAYGFGFGDKLLKKIAYILSTKFDAFKTFRVSSDEFVLLYKKEKNIIDYIKKLQKYFYNNSLNISGVILNVSFNYGACIMSNNLLEKASWSLKYSKDIGKNRYYIYNEKQDRVKQKEKNRFIAINQLLHKAIKSDQIIPFFQGIRDNKTGNINKYEALVRIETDDRILSPIEFLDVAALSGLLPEITKIMIDKSFKIMQNKDYEFSINITEDDLNRNYLIQYLREKSKEYNITPKRVALEILEGISQFGKNSHIVQLKELKANGYCLALDDFGIEYSNFERVLNLDIDVLKIDAKYIKNIDKDKKSYEIAKSIAYFAKNAGITCVAEFVHSNEVQKKVEELGIGFSQGFYFSRPKKIKS